VIPPKRQQPIISPPSASKYKNGNKRNNGSLRGGKKGGVNILF
jgi:hypothetical protein